jgi:hypothetical protein
VPPSSGAASPRELVGDGTSHARITPQSPVKTHICHAFNRGVSDPTSPRVNFENLCVFSLSKCHSRPSLDGGVVHEAINAYAIL